MKRNSTNAGGLTGLRRRAEHSLRDTAAPSPDFGETDVAKSMQRALHELSVHQIELEMQDEELRRSQSELAAAQSRYLELYDLAPAGYCTVSLQGLILEANLKAAILFGVSREALLGKPISQFVHCADREFWYLHRDRIRENQKPVSCELRMLRQKGAPFWAHLAATCACEVDGTPLLRLVLSDISERKRIDEALRVGDLRTQRVIQAAGVGLWDWDMATDEVYFSPEWKKQIGYTDAEIPNRYDEWEKRLHPDDRESTLAGIRESRAGRKAGHRVEFRFRHKDGSWRWIYTQADFLCDAAGKPVRMMGSHIDVTEQHRLRDAIEEMRDCQSAIIDASMDAIVSFNEGDRIVVFNAAAERLFRMSAAAAIGQPFESLIPERFRAAHHAHLNTYVQAGESARAPVRFSSLVALRADGAEFPVEASISRIKAGGKRLFNLILRDISEHQQDEAARTSLEAQLRESQKMEAIGTLSSGIAHDFNNILAIMLGNAELAREDAGLCPPTLEALDEISKAGKRGRELVQQILTFSRRQPTVRKPLSLGPVVEESVHLLRATLPARLILRCRFADDLPAVQADATQIQQILINLVTNAMQAMHSRTGSIEVLLDAVSPDTVVESHLPALRRMQARHPGRMVRMVVGDDGPGMDAATLKRVFEPFYTTKPVGQGTGLGLSVVYGIVQAHEGVIVADSMPGLGASFTLYLPASDAGPGSIQSRGVLAAADPAPKAQGGKHVLYLDDEDSLVLLVKRLLQRRGYRVSGYECQQEALDALRADPAAFDLVVTDFNMPGMSGLDVAREVQSIRADLPVVITSGYIDDALRVKADGAGVRDLIFKANVVEEFCDAVERALSRHFHQSGPPCVTGRPGASE